MKQVNLQQPLASRGLFYLGWPSAPEKNSGFYNILVYTACKPTNVLAIALICLFSQLFSEKTYFIQAVFTKDGRSAHKFR
jgi:hypothetical protein